MYPQKCNKADRSWISKELGKVNKNHHAKICAQYSDGYDKMIDGSSDHNTEQDARTRANTWLRKRIIQINSYGVLNARTKI